MTRRCGAGSRTQTSSWPARAAFLQLLPPTRYAARLGTGETPGAGRGALGVHADGCCAALETGSEGTEAAGAPCPGTALHFVCTAAPRHPPDRTARGARVSPRAPRPDQARPTGLVRGGAFSDAGLQRPQPPSPPPLPARFSEILCHRRAGAREGPWFSLSGRKASVCFSRWKGPQGELHPASGRVPCGEGRRCLSLGEAVGERWCLVAHPGCRGAGRSLGRPQVQIPEHPGASPEALRLVTPGRPRQAGRVSSGGDGVPSWFLDPGSGAL